MSQLALARRYRPQTFQAVIGQEETLRTLQAALDTQHLHHAYLFTGTRGIGKTTLARILAKCLNCERGISARPCEQCNTCLSIQAGAFVDLIEVDAASRTKVEDTRDLLDNVQYLPTQGRFKIYLIDEVHMLSGHSFNALLKTLEEPPSHVKFILATTDPQKLPVTILSRCLKFHLRRLSFSELVNYLGKLLDQEGVAFEPEALDIIARSADGSLRDALSVLDQVLAYCQGQERMLASELRKLLGLTEQGKLQALFSAIAANEPRTALQGVASIAEYAPDFSKVLIEFLTLLHQIALAKQIPEALDESMDQVGILACAQQATADQIQLYYQIALMGQRDLPYAPSPLMGFEMIILRMLAFQPVEIMDPMPSVKIEASVPALEKTVKTVEPSVLPASPVSSRSSDSVQPKKDTIVQQQSQMGSDSPSPIVNPKPRSTETASTIQKINTEAVKNSRPSKQTQTSKVWTDVIPHLHLSGMTKELASHCSVFEWSADAIHLLLDETQKPLLNKRYEERLQEALSAYVGKPIRLRITVGQGPQETPAIIHQKQQSEALNKAQIQMAADPNIVTLINTFDAKIEQITLEDHKMNPKEKET